MNTFFIIFSLSVYQTNSDKTEQMVALKLKRGIVVFVILPVNLIKQYVSREITNVT